MSKPIRLREMRCIMRAVRENPILSKKELDPLKFGFNEAVRTMMRLGCPETRESEIRMIAKTNFAVPDAWAFDFPHLYVLEVEDTNGVDRRKMKSYLNLASELDKAGIELVLVRISGRTGRDVELQHLATLALSQEQD